MDRSFDTAGLLARQRMELDILQLLIDSNWDRPLWSVVEVVRETADPILALDAMAALCSVGLLQRKAEFILITQAALRFHQLITWP